MPEEGEGLDASSIAAITLGIVAWMSLLVAFLVVDNPVFFLFVSFAAGIAAFVLGLRAKRQEAAAIAAGSAAAGAVVVYGLTLMTMMAAIVYATGVLLFLCFLFLLFWLSWSPPAPSSGGGCECPSSCCTCGDCCGGCGDCGCGGCGDCGCGSGCGSCACAALVLPQLRAPLPPFFGPAGTWRRRVRALLAHGAPHHPQGPAFTEDVFVVRGARWCVGCFTTYPVFLVALGALVLGAFTPRLEVALTLGGLLAGAQLVSTLGYAKRRAVKVAVKASLGVGLAFLVMGIHGAPWSPLAKLLGLAALLGLAHLSALPRARRLAKMRAAH